MMKECEKSVIRADSLANACDCCACQGRSCCVIQTLNKRPLQLSFLGEVVKVILLKEGLLILLMLNSAEIHVYRVQHCIHG